MLRWLVLVGLGVGARTGWWGLWQRLQETVLEAQTACMLVVWGCGGSNGRNGGGGRRGSRLWSRR